jgi:hypothetical protein
MPLIFVALGVLATWPRVTYLVTAQLPNSRDEALYVWDMWWVAHQAGHFASPFFTHQIYAPAGVPLAYDTLMPLVGLIMMPVTVIAGPVFSVNVLSVLLPGLLCYAMYRAARLWLPPTGAFAAAVFFGLSSMLTWRAWFQLNIAAGALFLPVTLEAAVRLRRDPSAGRAAALGLVIGLCLLVDLESAVLAVIVAAVVLAGWIAGDLAPDMVRLLGLAAAVALVVASPQLIAMVAQASASAADPDKLAQDYLSYSVAVPQMFTPSPRLSAYGLRWLAGLFYDGIPTEGMPTFGVTLTALAVLGAVAGWRNRRPAGPRVRTWLLLWLGASVLALGPVLHVGRRAFAPLPIHYHGQIVSLLMPDTWLVLLPGLSGFREPDRFTDLALLPAALLAGYAVVWITERVPSAFPLVVVLAAAELGWSYPGAAGLMPAGLPALDRAIAADRSQSLVVDVPLSWRSGTTEVGPGFPAEALVEATLDGHPRAIGYASRLPKPVAAALLHHAFYADLLKIQAGRDVPASAIPAAIADTWRLDVGWVLVWAKVTPRLGVFLAETGFSFRYRVDGTSVYQAPAGPGR